MRILLSKVCLATRVNYPVNIFIHYLLCIHVPQMLNSLVLWLERLPWNSLKGKSSLTQLLSEGGGVIISTHPFSDSPAVVWEQIYHLPRLIYWPEGYYHTRLCMEPVGLHSSHNKQTPGNIKKQRNICSVSDFWQEIRDFKDFLF